VCVCVSLFILATGSPLFYILEDSTRYQFQKLLLVLSRAKCLSTHTWDLDLKSHPKDLLVILDGQSGNRIPQYPDYKARALTDGALRAG
jgi:hypothetical protein